MMPLRDLLAALDTRTIYGWRSREPELHPEHFVYQDDDTLLEAAEHYLSMLHRDTEIRYGTDGHLREYERYRSDWTQTHKGRGKDE